MDDKAKRDFLVALGLGPALGIDVAAAEQAKREQEFKDYAYLLASMSPIEFTEELAKVITPVLADMKATSVILVMYAKIVDLEEKLNRLT